uniref:BHLH domain-containing protein n=1 Tax=Meloidogyne hapla TaxID=6305 RepID=A0A1I8BNL7_MELHA
MICELAVMDCVAVDDGVAAHNELEKNRRANLRGHLEALKSVLPPESDAHRDTTLSLLTRARNYIKFVDEQKTALLKKREALLVEHHRLQQLLQQNVGEPQGQQYNDNFKESTSLISLTTQNENNFDNLQQRMKIVQIPEEREEEEENFDFTQYQVSHEFCIEENVEEENIQVETNTKPNMEYLSLNGLLPALPLLYPYSSINMAGTTTANLC